MSRCLRNLRFQTAVALCLVAVAMLASIDRLPAAGTVPVPTRERIAALIDQLGDADYFARERAQEELARFGVEAFDALTDAANHEDIEVSDRARYLIRQIRVQWAQNDDPADVKKIMQDYEASNEQERLDAIDKLAKLPAAAGLPALARLVRFESSHVLSKRAAVAIIDQPLTPDIDWAAREKALNNSLGASPRPAAQWLRTDLTTRKDPAAAAAAWSKLAEAEYRTLNQFPRQSHPTLVVDLLKREAMAMRGANREDAALAAMRKMIDIEQQDDEALLALLNWLMEQKAWQVVELAATKFADRFEQEPMLLYTVAEACDAQGNSKLAEETAARARKLNEGVQFAHLFVAYKLMQRGKFKWSETEYRIAIDIGPPGASKTIDAQSLLAEMLHDQANELGAAKVLEEATAALEAALNAGRDFELSRRGLKSLKSRMHFFYATHEESQGNRAAQLDRLYKGIAEDPLDADVLIGLYRYPDLDAAARDKTRAMIRQAAEEFSNQINQAPEDAGPYNQYAWLVGNTEGDQKKALEYSQKSLDIKPNTAGYLDTLGRCYFALGDLENAVKYQTQAIELEPHSGQMQRQLAAFKEALAKSGKK